MRKEDAERLNAIGQAMASAGVQLLRQHNPCDCIHCRGAVARLAIGHMFDGTDDLDAVEVEVREIVRAMLYLRKQCREVAAFDDAVEEANAAPMPTTRPQ